LKIFRWLSKYIKKYIPQITIGIISLICVDLLLPYIPTLTGKIIDTINSGFSGNSNIRYLSLKLLIIALVIFTGRVIWRYFIFGSARNIVFHISNYLYKHLQTLPQNYFVNNKTGDLMSLFSNDLNAVRMALGQGAMMAIDGVFMTLFILLTSFSMVNPLLTIIAVIPLPVIGIGGYFFGRSIGIRFKEKQEAFSSLTDHILESFSGIRVIKAFTREKSRFKEFLKENNNNYDKNIRLVNIFSILFPLVEIISGLSFVFAILIGGYMTSVGDITLGDFIAFNQLISLLIWPMVAIGWSLNIFSQGKASLERINTVLDENNTILNGTIDIPEDTMLNISITDLTFTYPTKTFPALKNISLEIPYGKSIGIIGRTGAGKSALIDLVTRLYDPPDRSIFLNGIDLKDYKIESLRQKIGVVTQEHYIFSASIKDNIALSSPEANLETIINASKKAMLHNEISFFPDGYNTITGEKGVALSGGQKQRLSIARSLIHNYNILIFDDSLSAVDTQTESSLIDLIKLERSGKTTIIISHRLNAVKECDTIFVFNNGTIEESGTHETLINNRGFYYDLYKYQQIEEEIQKT